MTAVESKLIRLSETAENLSDFLVKACDLLNISYRRASLEARLSHSTVWSYVVGEAKHGSEETIARLALFFKVPEVNLLRLAGYTPRYVTATHLLKEAEDVFQVLTDEEREDWIKYGRLLLQARKPPKED